MGAHACSSSTREASQDQKLEASLGYILSYTKKLSQERNKQKQSLRS